jgi:hypothetical protein
MSTDVSEEPDDSLKRQFKSTSLDGARSSNSSTKLINAADRTEARF